MLTTIVIWALTTFPMRSNAELAKAGIDPSNDVAVAAYTMDHSIAGSIGKAVEPVFEPLGFDWRIDVSLIGSLAAREVSVSTLGQMASATDPEDDVDVSHQLDHWTWTHGQQGQQGLHPGHHRGTHPLLCLRPAMHVDRGDHETGDRRMEVARRGLGYMFVLAWVMAFIGRLVTGLLM
ncbi:ferrous iron transport protein B [Cutibacterium acnes JCM 18920]|nr:ferrous iron transport protein B [Cutibacterium acnes JCM 18920]